MTEAKQTADEPTYADLWRDAINETYTDRDDLGYVHDCLQDGEDYEAAVLRILTKAADCLRGGETHSFSGEELDAVRHLMPAHEVHQSGARIWVGQNFTAEGAEAKAQFDLLAEQLSNIAAMRRQLDDSEMPEDVRQMILGLRQTLCEAGLPEEMIDETAGLELP
ncbi:hypothetical protein [Mycobacterium sp.]|uniref:hypothetical protein n=1 Tax=Mycobacterium sp. TaxID=1785 RepID=UPI00120C015A|nr:hypothetical protein [Mycobacterium sp.]TAM63540.1 MAG: hypothetical protein EPN51_26590 [Mycobacterium sp.]